jgi:cytochrome c biogenesis protein CcmG/thiol:disulfide interchange protein DsbE
MLVHLEPAASADLTATAGVVMFELTGGSGASGGSESDGTLAGLPARRARGGFDAGGATQRIDALVAVESGRAWALVLAGRPEPVARDQADFDRMAATFRLTGRQAALPARAALGQPAPRFAELDRIRGPVVLNFYATWCAPCRQEMPMLAQRAAQSRGRFTVLVMETRDDPALGPGFLKELGLNFGSAGYDPDGKLSEQYQLPGVPGTFFLDSRHVVRQWVLGPLTASSLDAGIRDSGT